MGGSTNAVSKEQITNIRETDGSLSSHFNIQLTLCRYLCILYSNQIQDGFPSQQYSTFDNLPVVFLCFCTWSVLRWVNNRSVFYHGSNSRRRSTEYRSLYLWNRHRCGKAEQIRFMSCMNFKPVILFNNFLIIGDSPSRRAASRHITQYNFHLF